MLDFHLTAYPVQPGLQPIPKISVSDIFLKKTYEFSEMAYIHVKESWHLLEVFSLNFLPQAAHV